MIVCQKTEPLNENSFEFTVSFFFFKQAKEWTPAGKTKKENAAKKFYSESEEEEDSSDSSSDSGRVYNSLKNLCSVQFICYTSNKTIRPSI